MTGQRYVLSLISLTLVVLIFCHPISSFAEAPEISFDATFGVGFDINEEATDIIQLDDGSFVLAGWTGHRLGTDKDFYIVKTDSTGIELWSKTFGGDQVDVPSRLISTNDGNIAVLGYSYSFGAGGSDVWLIKVDSMGNEIWNKTFGGTEDDVGTSILQATDGGFLISGYTKSYGAGGADGWIIKTDSAGNEEWSKTFGNAGDDYLRHLIFNNDNEYLSVGATGKDGWCVKFDLLGNLLWQKTFNNYPPYFYSNFNGVQKTDDGGYILVGGIFDIGGTIGTVAWLVKLDIDGNHVWDVYLDDGQHENGLSVFQQDDGGYIVTINKSFEIWILKTDSTGFALWSKILKMGSNPSRAGKCIPTIDGGYAVAGCGYDALNRDELWLIKLGGKIGTLFTISDQSFASIDASIGDSIMGDIDNDGDLDLVMSGGNGASAIYVSKNDGLGQFYDTIQQIGSGFSHDLLLRDFDNDGDLDIVFYDNGNLKLFKNNGSGNFTDSGFSESVNLHYMLAADDLDNDGDVDFLAASQDINWARVYLNDGTGIFTQGDTIPVGYCHEPDIEDLDGDGDFDIGLSRNMYKTMIYSNDGTANFPVFDQISGNYHTQGGVYFVDVDGDGISDLFEANYSSDVSKLFFNDGLGTFTDSLQAFGGYLFDITKAAFGDIDNDGDFDLLVSSIGTEAYYFNNGMGTFSRGMGLFKAEHISLGDVDNDGDLDVFSGKKDGTGLGLFINNISESSVNSLPTEPNGFASFMDQNILTLSWQPGSDAETHQNLLTYNLRIGTTPGGHEVFSGVMPSGTGNVGHSLTWSIKELSDSTYYL